MIVENIYHLQAIGLRCLIASLLVMLVAWGVVMCLRNHSAALRHRILSLGLGGLVLLPLLVILSQRTSPVIHVQASEEASSGQGFELQAIDHDELGNSLEGGDESHVFSDDAIATGLNEAMPHALGSQIASADTGTTLPLVEHDTAIEFPTFHNSVLPMWSLPFVVWLLVLAAIVLRGILLRWLLMRLVRSSIEVSDERTTNLARTIAEDKGIRKMAVLCSDSLQVPVAVGVLNPTIILPVGYGKWSNERLRVVLLHEASHIGRADIFAQSIASLACAIFWGNPFVWLAARRMRLERELASDDSVLLSGEDAVKYSEHLIEIAEALRGRSCVPAVATAMATHTNLSTRVNRLIKSSVDRSQVSRRLSSILFLTSLVLLTVLTIVTPVIAIAPKDSDGLSTNALSDQTEATIEGNLDVTWLDSLKNMASLRKLTIRNPRASFQASSISELIQLQSLYVENLPLETSLADAIMVNAAKMPALREVTFKATGLTGEGLRGLKDSKIESLSLIDEESMIDDGFQYIAKMPSLKKLVLDGTPIEAPGLEHLCNALTLTSFALLHDRGATERIPVIASFPALVELELHEEVYKDLVVLKHLTSLRRLTLRHCGAFKASDSLAQLTQLDRLELDNPDIRNESFREFSQRMAAAGIDVVDITRLAASSGDRTQSPNQATKLARMIHREMDFAKKHPTLWIQWRSKHGETPSMSHERGRTLHKLKTALDEPRVKRSDTYDSQDCVIAWAPGQMYHECKCIKDEDVHAEYYKFGDRGLAHGRERYQIGEPTFRYLRNGVSAFADSLYDIPPNLKVSLQSYWWGTGKDRWASHDIATSPYSVESVVYEELPMEDFGGERCRVVQSAGRSERLWIGVNTGRLRGVLNFGNQGFRTPFYKQPIVTEIVGHKVATTEEYRTLVGNHSNLPRDKVERLGIAWSEYVFENAIPWSLHEFNDYREIAPGSWFPFNVRSSGWSHLIQNEKYYSFRSSESVVSRVDTKRSNLRLLWDPLLPENGDTIQDQRFAVPVDYPYGQTSNEIEQLVSEALFSRAKSAMLWAERRSPLNKLVGKPAIELPNAGWLGDRPELIGKPYLLHFWATWCGPCKNDIPWLNEISKNTLVVGVHPNGTTEDEIRQSISNEEMMYPTVVSGDGTKDPLGYPVTIYPYCIRVDEKGNVVKHGMLSEVLGRRPKNQPVVTASDAVLSGVIQAIKSADSLVQVSIGASDGLRNNQVLNVFRGEELIGTVRIVLVTKDKSVGKILNEKDVNHIKSGASLRFR